MSGAAAVQRLNPPHATRVPPARSAKGIATARDAKRHWLSFGMREGLRAHPDFSASIYLHRNRDLEDLYGPDNYPMAIAHYVTRGFRETFRETGGPSRIPILDHRVFDWKFYVEKNNFLKQSGVDTFEKAAEHWRSVGIDRGLQASPNLWVKEYLDENLDLQEIYGKENYRAALSHWLSVGHRQTWRKNGGSTCAFWSTWCQGADSITQKAMDMKLAMPAYNYSLAPPGFTAPVPQDGGWSVSINDRECSDLGRKVSLPPSSTRVQVVTHMHFAGRAGELRPCNVRVRKYFDIQTRMQGHSIPPLSLTRWSWRAPGRVHPTYLMPPMSPPRSTRYAGYTWVRPADGYTFNASTFEGPASPLLGVLNYSISAFVMEDPLTRDDESDGDDVIHLPPTEFWSLVHHWRPDQSQPIPDADLGADGGAPVPAGPVASVGGVTPVRGAGAPAGASSGAGTTQGPSAGPNSLGEEIQQEYKSNTGVPQGTLKYHQSYYPSNNVPLPAEHRVDYTASENSREKSLYRQARELVAAGVTLPPHLLPYAPREATAEEEDAAIMPTSTPSQQQQRAARAGYQGPEYGAQVRTSGTGGYEGRVPEYAGR